MTRDGQLQSLALIADPEISLNASQSLTNNTERKFCGFCGKKQASARMRYCSYCGEKVHLISLEDLNSGNTTASITLLPSTSNATQLIRTPAEKPKSSKIRRIGNVGFIILLAGAVMIPPASAVYLGVDSQTVVSGSMRPTFNPGDMLISKIVRISQVRVGDILVLLQPNQTFRAHRVISIKRGKLADTIVTRGDANALADDPYQLSPASSTRRVLSVVPKMGYVLDALAKPRNRVSGVIILFLLAMTTLKRPRLRKKNHD